MQDLQSNIKRVNDKLQRLLKLYQQLQKDNERQSKLIAELQQTKEKNTQHIHQLQEQVDILKAATGKMSEAEKKAFEKHLQQYIKEIDKCIGLLAD